MAKLIERLKRIVRGKPNGAARRDRQPRRRDSYSERLLAKDIEEASPERAGEAAGHPVERVDT